MTPEASVPYPGLAPFEEKDSWVFCGREEEIRVITANLQAARLTLLYGESGSGKTSLLNAGVSSTLRQQAKEEIERWNKPDFIVVTLRNWLGDPFELFASELRKACPTPLSFTTSSLSTLLRLAGQQTDRGVLVILDQFEEYFRYLSDGRSSQEFLQEFEAIWGQDVPVQVNFLLSMREDSLGLLDRLKGRIPNPFDNYLRLDHLSVPGAREAILGPVARYNKVNHSNVEFSTPLANRLIERITGHPIRDGALDRVPASVLQLVLTRWWNRQMATRDQKFKIEVLDKLGGIENIVGDHLRETIISESLQEDWVAPVFVPLVTESGRKIAVFIYQLEIPVNTGC